MTAHSIKISVYIYFSLIAFAANSVLCRLALVDGGMSAANFTIIRLLSAIIVLVVVLFINHKITYVKGGHLIDEEPKIHKNGNWLSSFLLFVYAATFSYAYASLDIATGVFIIFTVAQFIKLAARVVSGRKLHYSEWIGISIAAIGFVYLVKPLLNSPALQGVIYMTISGIAWSTYSLIGRKSTNPTNDSAYNFVRTLPFVVILASFAFEGTSLTVTGIYYAVLSGVVTSGLAYTVWYIVLKEITVEQSAFVQVAVPVIAILGAIVFVRELLSPVQIVSGIMIIIGILMVIYGHYHLERKSNTPEEPEFDEHI
jgi:drug/metabolite transporter (DMT)-like permease